MSDASTPPEGVAPEIWNEFVGRQQEAQLASLDRARQHIAAAEADIPPPSAAELLLMIARSKVKQPGGAYGLRAAPGAGRRGIL